MRIKENKTYFDKLGTKYKGELTDLEPFDLTQAKEKETWKESVKQVPQKKASPRKGKSPSKRPNRTINKSPESLPKSKSQGKGMVKTVQINPTKTGLKSSVQEESKMEERYAKLRIHYSKDNFAEIKVFENTEPSDLAAEFCKEYNLSSQMQKQLIHIINAKLQSLKSVNELDVKNITASEPDEELKLQKEKQQLSEEEKEHLLHNEDAVDSDSMNEEYPNSHEIEIGYDDEDEDMRDSSQLPIPENFTREGEDD